MHKLPQKVLCFVYLVLQFNISIVFGNNIPGSTDNKLKIGLLIPYDQGSQWDVGRTIGASILVAIDDINNNTSLLNNFTIEYAWNDTHCSANEGLTAALNIWKTSEDLDVFIGGGCSSVCEPVALVSAVWNLPHISWGCNSADLSNKHKYPTFTRSVGPWTTLAPMFRQIFDKFGWNRVAIVASTDTIYQLTASTFRDEFLSAGKTVYRHDVASVIDVSKVDVKNLAKMKEVVKLVKNEARVIILLLGNRDINQFLLLAESDDMYANDPIFLSIETEPDHTKEDPVNHDRLKKAYIGLISCVIRTPDGFSDFAQRVADKSPDFDPSNAVLASKVDVHAALLHDAVLMWAHGVTKVIEKNSRAQLDNGLKITEQLMAEDAVGMNGKIHLDENGDRKLDYTIRIWQESGFLPLFDYNGNKMELTKLYKGSDESDYSGIKWVNDRTQVPSDSPECGWDGEKCDNTKLVILIVSFSLLFLVFLIFMVYFTYRKIDYERDLHDHKKWRVYWNEIQKNQLASQAATQRSMLKADKTLRNLGHGGHTSSKTVYGTYKGKDVAIKKLDRNTVKIEDLTRDDLLSIKLMRTLEHPNLNTFVGICLEAPNFCILMTHCPRGSLQDICLNNSINLTRDLTLSLAKDIAKGMVYIHESPLKYHGNLSSTNVVVDSKWTAKLTDYGLLKFKEGVPQKTENNLWKAPEILRCGPKSSHRTQEGDVYSYGIMLYELITRKEPFLTDMDEKNIEGIVERIKSGTRPYCRPRIPDDICSLQLRRLTNLCWAENFNERPNFKVVLQTLREMSGGSDVSYIQNAMNNLDEQAERLEEAYSEAKVQLESTQEKYECLLMTMLPKAISKRLEEGDALEPKVLNSISILRSGFEDFLGIIERFPPSDVALMLSSIWWKIENACEKYEVFRSDSSFSNGELIFSGVPDEHDHHTNDLLLIANNLVEDIMSIEIPALKDEPIPWKGAIHTGPCLSIVTAHKAPRYCLYGDTIRVTNQIFASSKPLNVLISNAAYLNLSKSLESLVKKNTEDNLEDGKPSYWLQLGESY